MSIPEIYSRFNEFQGEGKSWASSGFLNIKPKKSKPASNTKAGINFLLNTGEILVKVKGGGE